jgi:hypothetical protein
LLAGVVERKLERACQLVRLDIQPSTLLLFLLLLLLLLLLLPLLEPTWGHELVRRLLLRRRRRALRHNQVQAPHILQHRVRIVARRRAAHLSAAPLPSAKVNSQSRPQILGFDCNSWVLIKNLGFDCNYWVLTVKYWFLTEIIGL